MYVTRFKRIQNTLSALSKKQKQTSTNILPIDKNPQDSKESCGFVSIIIFWYGDLGGQSEVGLLIGFFADHSDTSPKQTPSESDASDKEKISDV